jgi:hypothetical protein
MAEAVYEIPVSASPQRFNIPLGGTEYELELRWNHVAGAWVLNISTPAGVPVLHGLPLITGADLLAQHRHLGFTGGLLVVGDPNPDEVPDFYTLGTGGKLYFVVPE